VIARVRYAWHATALTVERFALRRVTARVERRRAAFMAAADARYPDDYRDGINYW
jgi:hypothetical protein